MKTLRLFIVMIGTIVLATLSINAFDNYDQPSKSLLGAAYGALIKKDACPSGTVFVGTSAGGFCADTFEASAGDTCPHPDPRSQVDTDDNLALSSCKPFSQQGATPWRNVTRQQAELACAHAGKRLPSNQEWYHTALGTPDKSSDWTPEDCNVHHPDAASPDSTGVHALCVSPLGAYDLIGNVWEWTEETVNNGTYKSKKLPGEGYVTSIDDEGIPLTTNFDQPDPSFFNDYLWVDSSDVRGILRGGYWKSNSEAGEYAVNAAVLTSFSGDAVGFRCVKDIAR